MKRSELIQNLVNEGFSEKTLVNMSDKQINVLAERILGESTEKVIKKISYTPSDVNSLKTKGQGIAANGTVTLDKNGGMTVTQGEGEEINEISTESPKSSKNKMFSVGKLRKESKKKDEIKRLAFKKLNESEIMNKWINNLVDAKYHPTVKKGEISEMINLRIKNK